MIQVFPVRWLVVLWVTTMGVGCSWFPSGSGLPDHLARQVIQSDHCGLTELGLTYIKSAEELTQFASLQGQNLAIEQLRALEFGREHILIAGMGQKPTGGFGLTLASSKIEDDVLTLTVFLRRPPADAVVSQALTTPCAVLAITPDHWDSLEVKGNGLQTLRLDPQFNR